jgi:hypothetical protein
VQRPIRAAPSAATSTVLSGDAIARASDLAARRSSQLGGRVPGGANSHS